MFTAQQLHDEIVADPKQLGYAAHVSGGDDQGVADILNATYAGVGVVWRSALPAGEILGSLVASEVSGWTQAKWVAFTALISTGSVDASNPNIRALFSALLTGAAGSLANVTAAAEVVAPTRAEELWGEGTIITPLVVAQALGRA